MVAAISAETVPRHHDAAVVSYRGVSRALLQQFVSAGNALLAATSSFWRVDVRGDTLSLVIIDKLPFTSPDDPLLKARMEDRRGG
ncbi:helicase C-terminal domain-containing protein [Shigella flexneri]